MLINNLLSNAGLRPTAFACGTVRHKQTVELSISDDGPGIPLQERSSRVKTLYIARQCIGHGMSPAIAERIASWHKANISLDTDERLGGLCVRIIF